MSAKSKQTNERKLVQGYPLREVYDYEGRGIAVTEFIDGRKVSYPRLKSWACSSKPLRGLLTETHPPASLSRPDGY